MFLLNLSRVICQLPGRPYGTAIRLFDFAKCLLAVSEGQGVYGSYVTQRPAPRDAVTTGIDQIERFEWLNVIAVGHHEAK
jgi:hypothetical protein